MKHFFSPGRGLAAAVLLACASVAAHAQTGSVGIGTTAPDASAALDIVSTSKGLLLPRLTLAQRAALTASPTAPPVPGLVIYQTDNTPGLYAYDGTAWVRLGADNMGNHTATQNLNLGPNALVGNGGSTGLTVTGAGSAQLPTASAYTYAAPKAYAVSYGPSDFQAQGPIGTSFASNKVLNAPGSPNGFEQVYMDQAGSLRLALHLPQGAVVTSLLLYYTQTAANASSSITLDLLAHRLGNRGAVTRLATFTSAGTYTALMPVTITPSAAVVIDNATLLYSLRATFSASSSTLSITGVTVNYTVTQAD